MAETTVNSTEAWSPDLVAFKPADVIPEALILRASTVVTDQLEGDAPAARVPWVDDAAADFTGEGTVIPEADPALSEATVYTGKVSQLITVSREQYGQHSTAELLAGSTRRAVTNKVNQAFIAQEAPASGNTPPTGLLNTSGIVAGGTISANLDPLADLVGTLETNGATPGLIVANPSAWADLRKLHTTDTSNESLLGAGTDDMQRRLLGIETVTSPAVPAGTLLVVDPSAVASAVGQLQVATSEHAHFSSDMIALRATWRVGWAVQHADRLGHVSVDLTAAA